jgi:hypothetical protein
MTADFCEEPSDRHARSTAEMPLRWCLLAVLVSTKAFATPAPPTRRDAPIVMSARSWALDGSDARLELTFRRAPTSQQPQIALPIHVRPGGVDYDGLDITLLDTAGISRRLHFESLHYRSATLTLVGDALHVETIDLSRWTGVLPRGRYSVVARWPIGDDVHDLVAQTELWVGPSCGLALHEPDQVVMTRPTPSSSSWLPALAALTLLALALAARLRAGLVDTCVPHSQP